MKNKTLKIKITRYFLYTLLCILPLITFSQKAMNEQRAMKESHIDFTNLKLNPNIVKPLKTCLMEYRCRSFSIAGNVPSIADGGTTTTKFN